MNAKAFEDIALVVNPESDNAALVKQAVVKGSTIIRDGAPVTLMSSMEPGDRFALVDIPAGSYLYQYGFPFARSKGIGRGEKITCANTVAEIPPLRHDFVPPCPERLPRGMERTFMGYRRAEGSCGTRNFYIIVPTSMCSSAVAQQIADQFCGEHPGIDAVMALPNTEGCGCASGLQIERFLTVLVNFITHQNVGAALIVDLGCEQTNYPVVHGHLARAAEKCHTKPLDWLTIQKEGGSGNAVRKGVAIVSEHLGVAAAVRKPCPLSELVVGSECGASDAFSGVTANRVIGDSIDRIIAVGGSAIFSEFPEMVGAEQILFPRMRSRNVIEKFTKAMEWYRDMARRLGTTMDHNLVPENRAGGLINPYIKSLGAVMKGGTAVIEDVVEYGERICAKGLHIMQGPGNDLESVTGLAASGANIICFSTGRGTVTGCAIAPVIKISSTSALYARMPDDMDFDAGSLLDGHGPENTLQIIGERLLNTIVAVASGQRTKPEIYRQRQFQIWTAGKLSL